MVTTSGPTEAERRALFDWFDQCGRDLPWRASRDPWLILVSEFMLQQTQVSRVLRRLPVFMAQFPTPAACAAASPGAVIAQWQGLGYNRRALQLHRAARAVVTDHGGRVPGVLAELLALPGVGAYTARAVLAFAFEADVAVIDTNIGRILARVAGNRLRPAAARALAEQWVPAGEGWRWNQSLMELGALVCRRDPDCGRCPLRPCCLWAAQGCPAPDPAQSSAGVSTPQSRFVGSDRQGRGRLVDALRLGPVATTELAVVMGWPEDPARAARVAEGVRVDGLAVCVDDRWELPTAAV